MRNIIFIILVASFLYACKKDSSTDPTTNTTTQPPATTQDSRLVASWILDSIRTGAAITSKANVHLGSPRNSPPCDSMTFSTDHYVGYGYMITYYSNVSSSWDKWDNPYSDSLFIHFYTAPTLYSRFKYSISGSLFIVTVPAATPSLYYYHKN